MPPVGTGQASCTPTLKKDEKRGYEASVRVTPLNVSDIIYVSIT